MFGALRWVRVEADGPRHLDQTVMCVCLLRLALHELRVGAKAGGAGSVELELVGA